MTTKIEKDIVRDQWLLTQGKLEKGSGHMDVWSKADRETRVRYCNTKWMRKPILSVLPER